jgi:hypothetical protein
MIVDAVLRSVKTCSLFARERALLNSGAEDLEHQWPEYIPAYRSLAGTGIGLAFGLWS